MVSDARNEPEFGGARASQLRSPKLVDPRTRDCRCIAKRHPALSQFVAPEFTEATNVNTAPDGTLAPDAR
jgi:hypothetical protein